MSIQRIESGRVQIGVDASGRCALALFIYMLIRTGCAFAEETAVAIPGAGREPQDRKPAPGAGHDAIAVDRWSAPEASFAEIAPKFQLPNDYSPHEYRALGTGLARRESVARDLDARPALRTSSAWDRLADYKTRGGIRLLTLWDTKFASLSLQTGHGGMAALQWTSRGFGGGGNGGGGTRGLLDRLLSTSIERFDALRHALRPPSTATAELPAERRDN
jgi:hypothetical protein